MPAVKTPKITSNLFRRVSRITLRFSMASDIWSTYPEKQKKVLYPIWGNSYSLQGFLSSTLFLPILFFRFGFIRLFSWNPSNISWNCHHSGGIRFSEATKFEYGNNSVQVRGTIVFKYREISSYLKNLYL